ncbi:MAG: DUF1552 domain-containing protein [Polyangiaceae bacterium]|nr:DUF1552 domain-containing protein [Polyangiaceae bacterium]
MSKSVLKRRSLLKQLGAAAFLATPVFRSVLAEAQTTFPLRLILLNLPGGIPFKGGGDSGGLDTYFDGIYKPWAALQSDMIVFDNVQNKAGDKVATFFELEGHGGGCRSIFGGAVNDQGCKGMAACDAGLNPEDEAAYNAVVYSYGTATTIDQTLAAAIGQSTPFDALHFGTLWDKGQGGDHAECFYKGGRAVRPMSDPMSAFTRLFGNGLPTVGSTPAPTTTATGTAAPDPATLNLYQRGKSRLDLLYAEIADVKALAGNAEQAKLDQHLTSLRELERGLPIVPGGGGGGGGTVGGGGPANPGPTCALPGMEARVQAGTDVRPVSAAFNELAYQSLNCDLTRIVALQWLSSGDHIPRFQFLGCSGDHHGMEHSINGGEYIKAQTWIFEQMVEFVNKLKNTPEGTGSMLDNSIVYLASEMGNGSHVLSPALSTIIGKAGGAFRTGRRVDMQGRNINDILTTVVNTMGLNAATVGDAEFNTGAISLS